MHSRTRYPPQLHFRIDAACSAVTPEATSMGGELRALPNSYTRYGTSLLKTFPVLVCAAVGPLVIVAVIVAVVSWRRRTAAGQPMVSKRAADDGSADGCVRACVCYPPRMVTARAMGSEGPQPAVPPAALFRHRSTSCICIA